MTYFNTHLLRLTGLALAAAAVLWGLELRRINAIAARDFGPRPCWFVPAVSAHDPPRLQPGPRGVYFPNLLRQLNRRFIGLGIEDIFVHTPHFAVAARGQDGMPELWGWSYRAQDFWSLRAAAEDLRDAFYDDYTDPDAIF